MYCCKMYEATLVIILNRTHKGQQNKSNFNKVLKSLMLIKNGIVWMKTISAIDFY